MKIDFRLLVFSAVLASMLSAGCISGFDRDAAEKRFEAVMLDNVGQEQVLLKTPMKVAVFADMETMTPPGEFEETWDWDRRDRSVMTLYLEKLQELGYISEFFVIPDRENLNMQDINQLLDAAQRQNADVLMTLRGIIQINSYLNPVAVLNLTIIGGWLFPASNRDAMIMVRMDLWSVKGRDCILTVRGEGVKKISEPTFLIDTEGAVESVKRDTLQKVFIEFKKRCREIKPAKKTTD